ncbi:cob(I)yrinic acid a,c-diamide adenosyltransferase [Desulfosporosinus sp. SB140]|uniref:cob(I)yrinic acid a,c-diamide adenosyltransferase n=1 Tax=Desulfosporosinus paludis TaxID=3115649 RepID=UPI0038904FE0
MRQGLIHIYTGTGKGKTTAAVGLGIRAYGQGLNVFMAQFLKGWSTGEMKTIADLGPRFQLFKYNKENDKFTWEMTAEEMGGIKGEMRIGLNYTIEAVMSGEWDLIIMDEIMAAVNCGFLPLEEVVEILKIKPPELELVLTGRDAPLELIELADYVSEITARKHPIKKGIMAREGIEY